jgi:adhesin/invasin
MSKKWLRRSTAICGSMLVYVAGLSCTSSTGPDGPDVSLQLSTLTAAQSSIVANGASSTAITLTLRDSDGDPATGAIGPITLSTTAGTISTPADGGSGVWTATLTSSTVAGNAVVTAKHDGQAIVDNAEVAFVAGPATAASVANTSSNGQTGTVGKAVANPPSVKVADANGNGVQGVTVTFAVTAGGGSLIGAVQTTNSSGVATVGGWILGNVAGPNTVTGTVSLPAADGEALAVGDIVVTFTATGVADVAGSIALNGGDGQTAVAGTAVTTAPSVKVVDANNNPVGGAAVTFAVAAGGGAITGAGTTTNSSGIATVGSWTLGNAAGPNSITASTPGVSGLVTITATGVAGPAVSIEIANPAAASQSAAAGSAVAIPPSVKVVDARGNAVAGASVTFAVSSGGGSITGGNATTASNGIATVGSWTLGTTAGPNSLSASSGTLSGSPVTFNATGLPGSAGAITIVAGDGQTATVGTGVAVAPSVKVSDVNGNAVAGAVVTFSIVSGGGTVTGATATTSASGIATAGGWTLGTTAGPNELAATSGGVTPIVIRANAVAAAAAKISLSAGNNQSAAIGLSLPVSPAVLVTDAFNNPVAGVAVTFAIASGGGSITGGASVSDASGIATAGTWTLGPSVGANTVTATAAGLTGSPVLFSATATAGVPAKVVKHAGDNQTAVAGANVAVAPAVKVTTANDLPVPGISVVFAVATGGGSLIDASATTNAEGIASPASWRLGTTAGPNTVTATVASLPAVTFSATATSGPATAVAINAGNNQSAVIGNAVTIPPSVKVTDANGNAVSGVAVTFAVATGGGSVSGATATTNASGIATVGSWTLGASLGSNTLTATAGTLTGSPLTFTATAIAGPPASITKHAGDAQTAVAGANVATPPAVRVTAENGLPLQGITVTFAVGTGGGSVTNAVALTNDNGIATVGSWKLGNTSGANTLTATVASLSPVTFTATGTAGPAALIVINAGNNQSAVVNTAVPIAPSVKVTDANGNVVEGAGVTFAVATGGGSITGGSATTNASGIATVGSWTLGASAGTNTLTASLDGVAGASVTITASAVNVVPLNVTVNGKLERSETVSVVVTQGGSPLPPSGYTLTLDPSDGGQINGDGTVKLLKAGELKFTATAGLASGNTTVTVTRPPLVLFDKITDGARHIWQVALDGGDLTKLTSVGSDNQHGSRVGDRLVYASARNGLNFDIWSMVVSTGVETRLTSTGFAETDPHISSNGAKVTYISMETGAARAMHANIDGTGAAPVADNSANTASTEALPAWSPGSDRIVFSSTSFAGDMDLWVSTTLGAVATRLTAPANSESSAELAPAWHTDDRIAFLTTRAGKSEIWITDVDGNPATRVTDGSSPTWLADGRIVFVRFIGATGSLFWVDPANPDVVHPINTGGGSVQRPSAVR